MAAARGEAIGWIRDNSSHSDDACLLWPFATTRAGYAVVRVPGTRTMTTAHRLMCELVHGPRPTDDHETAHSCGRGHLGCMNPRHLRWATHMENCKDREDHGNHKNMPKKLSDEQVAEIKSLAQSLPQSCIADIYGVSRGHICNVVHGNRRAA